MISSFAYLLLAILKWPWFVPSPQEYNSFSYSLEGKYWIHLKNVKYSHSYQSDHSCENSITYVFDTEGDSYIALHISFWNCDTTNYGRLRNDPRYIYELCKNGECLVDSFTYKGRKYYTRIYKDGNLREEHAYYLYKSTLISITLYDHNGFRIKDYIK